MARKYVELDTATHVAGVCVVVAERYIQRCCICGEKLTDSADASLQSMYAEGELVRSKDGALHRTGREIESVKSRLPRDLCIDLVEL